MDKGWLGDSVVGYFAIEFDNPYKPSEINSIGHAGIKQAGTNTSMYMYHFKYCFPKHVI